jgi:hypothetical protein
LRPSSWLSLSSRKRRTQGTRRPNRQSVSTVIPPGAANPPAERPRDPADIALDKTIKSICRGC